MKCRKPWRWLPIKASQCVISRLVLRTFLDGQRIDDDHNWSSYDCRRSQTATAATTCKTASGNSDASGTPTFIVSPQTIRKRAWFPLQHSPIKPVFLAQGRSNETIRSGRLLTQRRNIFTACQQRTPIIYRKRWPRRTTKRGYVSDRKIVKVLNAACFLSTTR